MAYANLSQLASLCGADRKTVTDALKDFPSVNGSNNSRLYYAPLALLFVMKRMKQGCQDGWAETILDLLSNGHLKITASPKAKFQSKKGKIK